MDIVSHGLWGSIAFGRKSRKSFWLAFFFGIFPDLFSFGIFTASALLGLEAYPDFAHDLPNPSVIPQYVHLLYGLTHSLIVFTAAFLLVWLIRKKPFWVMGAWGLHIFVDIPTHSYRFFPTPFLWPISGIEFNGHPWGDPVIFIPNIILLVTAYLWYFASERRKKHS